MQISLISLAAWAERATEKECIVKVKDAAALIQRIGIDAAMAPITDKRGPFVWKDTCVFIMDLQGRMLANPTMPELTHIGPLLSISDVKGKRPFAEFVKVANDPGEGWVEYLYLKKGMAAPIGKSTCIYRIPGTQYLGGADVFR